MKMKARDYVVQNFDWEMVAARYAELIRNI
jgi:hypothetical protein